MDNYVPPRLLPLLGVWKTPQVGLDKVPRWKKYLKKGKGVRRQNSLQHSLSIAILGSMVTTRLSAYVSIDAGFVITSLIIHDVGEGIRRKDVLYIDKTVEEDFDEYLAFRRVYESLDAALFDRLHHAFLLQFARKNPDIFPKDARKIMTYLSKKFFLEALIFDAVERWDYVLYALEQYHERGNKKILVQVLRSQISPLNELAEKIPGFGTEIWTWEIASWANGFIKDHEGMWIEEKGEV